MKALLRLPRVELASTPTPLQPAPGLSKELGVEVWLKRDDLTGLALGGNKVRILEYLVGDALRRGCDCLVTGAGPQSNWAMLATAAARRCGLDPYLVYYGRPREPAGNHLLVELLGADVRFTGEEDRTSVDPVISAVAAELARNGRNPYELPRGGATPVGSAGYVRAGLELAGQLADAGLAPGTLWLATGSCGTQAGLVAAAAWLRAPYQVVGVTVSRPAADCVAQVGALAAGVAGLLDLPAPDGDPVVLGGFLGTYGERSAEGDEATELAFRTEGLLLDPVFGAKAMAALAHAARTGQVEPPVVFLVSGGAPTLFAVPHRPRSPDRLAAARRPP